MTALKFRKNVLNREITCAIDGYDTRGEDGDQYNGEQTWECNVTFDPYSHEGNYTLVAGNYISYGGTKKDCRENMLNAIQQEIVFLNEVLSILKESI